MNSVRKKILISPLNWGLGHAARCIPIIKELQNCNYIPIIASDGIALELLRKEFPKLQTLELPSYGIEYTKNGKNLKWKLLWSLPKIIYTVFNEQMLVKKWNKEYGFDGIISDNRFGVFSKKIPSVYITHQVNVLSGNSTWLSSKLHQISIKKYNECWIPDFEGIPNLSGTLGHIQNADFNIKHIGPLSRMFKKETTIQYNLMILLSGPEPQRGLLEEKLKQEILKYTGNVVFIKGIIESEQIKEQFKNVTFYNFMTTKQLEQTINESEIIVCRSGYTTIMDLVKLEKKAFFIPTPGQYEQLYLAEKLQKEGLFPYAFQDDFKMENLSEIENYKGFSKLNFEINWGDLFKIFD